MLVHQILKSKADDAVVTVPPGTWCRMQQDPVGKGIGTVVVSEDGKTPTAFCRNAISCANWRKRRRRACGQG